MIYSVLSEHSEEEELKVSEHREPADTAPADRKEARIEEESASSMAAMKSIMIRAHKIHMNCREVFGMKKDMKTWKGEAKRAAKWRLDKIGKMLDFVMTEAAKEERMFEKRLKAKGIEMAKRAEGLKKEAEEELKTEAEQEELERRMAELEEEMERMEELKRRVREEEWGEEQTKIKDLVIQKLKGIYAIHPIREEEKKQNRGQEHPMRFAIISTLERVQESVK